MTTNQRQAAIAKIRIDNEHDWTYQRCEDECETVYTYVLDETAPFPALTDPNCMWDSFFYPLFSPINEWNDADERLFEVLVHPDHWNNTQNWVALSDTFVTNYIANQARILEPKGISVMPFVLGIWEKYKLDPAFLLKKMLDAYPTAWYKGEQISEHSPRSGAASSFGKYLVAEAKKDIKILDRFQRDDKMVEFFELMLNNTTELTETEYKYFLRLDPTRRIIERISVEIVRILLERDAEKYENRILEAMKPVTETECIYYVNELLRKHLPEKYGDKTLEHAYLFVGMVYKEMELYKISNDRYTFDHTFDQKNYTLGFYLIENAISIILKHDATTAKDKVFDCFKAIRDPQVKARILKLLFESYGDAILPLIFEDNWGFDKHGTVISDYTSAFFKYLEKTDYSAYNDRVWAFLLEKEKTIVSGAARTLAKQGDAAVPNAEKLLEHKKADVRQTGALILSLINTPAAIGALMQKLNTEADDTTRNIMLETIKNVLPMETESDMKAVVAAAKSRKKLDKPFQRWLIEAQMPRLYWLSGAELTDDETRFLFYRQTLSRDIRVDTEAKPMLALLDKTKSQPFAAALLKAFIDTGGDTKAKYCLALATSLGGDAEVDLLKSKVLYWVDNARGKMAEYAVKAIALNGSNKALRLIEFYSRKYKSKYKNIGAAANEAFDLVAEELGIPPYELADAIIPDFGFDGLFKEFEAGGETFRAFVSNDFKIMFLNEDNKLIKAVPKATSTALKDEFKDIAKEIRDIVKSQSSRLEQYLVIQRKWDSEKWQGFFLQNPVMFAYAIRLIWGAFDENGALLFTFRCNEDQTLINMEYDEIDLDESHKIGIVHPMSLDAETIAHWSESLLESDVTTIFPQLLRPVILMDEADKTLKMSKKFRGVKYNGYGFMSKMEKTGWYKGSIGDGGSITSFYKEFSSLGIMAMIDQNGILAIGYYEDDAELGNLYFVKNKSVKFGSYTYDDPSDENDSRLVSFGDVPPIVYSEVMADLQFFMDNRVE